MSRFLSSQLGQNKTFCLFFFVLLFLLLLFGLVVLASASSVYAFEKWGDSFYLLKHQILYGLLPGLILFFIGYFLPLSFWKKGAFFLLIFSLLLLFLVLVSPWGKVFGGSKSWLVFGNISFQPVEITKASLILFLAQWLERKRKNNQLSDFHLGFLPFLLLFLLINFLILAQKDLGSALIVSFILFGMYFLAGGSLRYLSFLLGIFLVIVLFLIKTAPYRVARLMIFLHPELDPQGVGYHINQAILAVGSGRLFGLGLGQSRQKYRFLPEVSGDSIFAVLAEELGFFLTAGFLLLLFGFFLQIFKIGKKAPDMFSRQVAFGTLLWLGGQSFLNISAMLNLLPLTGLPLPLISYGGSALACLLFILGIIAKINCFHLKI